MTRYRIMLRPVHQETRNSHMCLFILVLSYSSGSEVFILSFIWCTDSACLWNFRSTGIDRSYRKLAFLAFSFWGWRTPNCFFQVSQLWNRSLYKLNPGPSPPFLVGCHLILALQALILSNLSCSIRHFILGYLLKWSSN